MPEPTDKNSAEQIRAEYVETLARADYGRWQRAYDKVSEHQEWGDRAPSWEQAGEDRKRRDEAVRKADMIADDLAEAGLLPTAVDARYIGRGVQRRTRYVTEWQDPSNVSEFPKTSPLESGGQTTPMPPRPHIGTSEVAE